MTPRLDPTDAQHDDLKVQSSATQSLAQSYTLTEACKDVKKLMAWEGAMGVGSGEGEEEGVQQVGG